jgi:hypothetical protein
LKNYIAELKPIYEPLVKKGPDDIFEDHFRVVLWSETGFLRMPFEQLRPNKVGQLVELQGVVMQISTVYYRYSIVAWECPICATVQIQPTDGEVLKPPHMCTNTNCQHNKDFRINEARSTAIRCQYLFLKEIETNRWIKCYVFEDLCERLEGGEIITVWGIMNHEAISIKGRKNENSVIPFIAVQNIRSERKHQFSHCMDEETRVYLEPTKGIFMDKINPWKARTNVVCVWDELKIHFKFTVEEGPDEISHYIGFVRQGNERTYFYNVDFDELCKKIVKVAGGVPHAEALITVPLQKYLGSLPNDNPKIAKTYGFVAEGWRLPPEYILLIQDDAGVEIYKHLRKVMDAPMDLETVKKQFVKLYDLTGIKHKGPLFAFCLFSPFLSVFRQITDLMPVLALQGPPQTGKTPFFELIITRLFGNMDELINAGDLKSPSRVESHISSSTFMIVFDECTSGSVGLLDIIKSYLTTKSKMNRKGAGAGKQFAAVKKDKVAGLGLTANDSPDWFGDEAFLERAFIDIIDELTVMAGWKEARDVIPVGAWTRLLVDYTKDWDLAKLRAFIKELPQPTLGDGRKNAIMLAFQAGARLMEELFGIVVDLTPVSAIIEKTRTTNLDSLLELMRYQVTRGEIKNRIITQYDNTGKPTGSRQEYWFTPDFWVKTPLFTTRILRKGSLDEHYCWTVNNIRELQGAFEPHFKDGWKLQTFFQKIQKTFPEASCGPYTTYILDTEAQLIEKKGRCVVIPCTVFCDFFTK